jgi:hypothetical protein
VFDLHVHTSPDVVARSLDDVAAARRYAAAGFTGAVLKGHCAPTAGRAAAARDATGFPMYGGIALNAPAGGLNPIAVAAALALGARVVWMPTVDACTQGPAGLARPFGEHRLAGAAPAYALPPVDPAAEQPLTRILALIAEADAVLATGHVSTAEVAWLLPAARRAGVRRVLLTHPSYTVPAMSPVQARELAEQGAYAEITAFQLLHQPGCDAATLATFVREVGVRRCVLSSDAGQPDSPPPPEALEGLVDSLAAEGIARADLVAMAGETPERLVTG